MEAFPYKVGLQGLHKEQQMSKVEGAEQALQKISGTKNQQNELT